MSEENPKQQKEQPPSGGGDPQLNWRGLVLLAVGLALIGGVFLFRGGNLTQTDEISNKQFLDYLKEGKVLSDEKHPVEVVVEEGRNTQYFEGKVKLPSPATGEEIATPFRTPIFTQFNGSEIEKVLADAGIVPAITPKSDLLASAIVSFLPIILFLVILFFHTGISDIFTDRFRLTVLVVVVAVVLRLRNLLVLEIFSHSHWHGSVVRIRVERLIVPGVKIRNVTFQP
jgi:hypothetical protein